MSDDSTICKFCHKKFSTKGNCEKHKNICKIKKITELEQQKEKFLEEKEKEKDKIIESKDKETIYGFCRLRLSNNMGFIKSGGHKESNNKIDEDINLFPYLNNMAMIRELHVYGVMTPLNKTKNNKTQDASHQHKGYGKILIKVAENIAIKNNFHKIGVISGVGVREYYRKLGFTDFHTYLIKIVDAPRLYTIISVTFFSIIIILYFIAVIYKLFL
jgi:histone acetyltransferase (RNA polymerase elongator complex component)